MLSKGASWMLSSKPQVSAPQAAEGPVLSFRSRLPFPFLWVPRGEAGSPGRFGNLGQVGSTPIIKGRSFCISDNCLGDAAAAGPGTPYSEVLLFRMCCPKAGLWMQRLRQAPGGSGPPGSPHLTTLQKPIRLFLLRGKPRGPGWQLHSQTTASLLGRVGTACPVPTAQSQALTQPTCPQGQTKLRSGSWLFPCSFCTELFGLFHIFVLCFWGKLIS